ncbi:MAG TPA: GAF and ANTAR domain-containing protein [Acidimicrobiales bacterium]|nr:GAF and ANTAR domain-containing protein [Acidimicrobiales bacterium]
MHTLVDLAGGLVADFDTVELLTLLSDRCVEALDVAAAGVMIAPPAGSLQVVASSSDAMRALEVFQLQSDQGPCLEAFRSGRPVVNQDLAANADRWPRFGPQAIAAGFRSTHSLPMRLRGRTIGALNLFRSDDGVLGADDVVAAQALADVATIVIVHHEALLDARALNDQLNRALQSRIVIEQAKGKVSEAASLDMDQSFRRLRNHARNHNVRLTDLAAAIAAGTLRPEGLDRLPPGR